MRRVLPARPHPLQKILLGGVGQSENLCPRPLQFQHNLVPNLPVAVAVGIDGRAGSTLRFFTGDPRQPLPEGSPADAAPWQRKSADPSAAQVPRAPAEKALPVSPAPSPSAPQTHRCRRRGGTTSPLPALTSLWWRGSHLLHRLARHLDPIHYSSEKTEVLEEEFHQQIFHLGGGCRWGGSFSLGSLSTSAAVSLQQNTQRLSA